jgi:hypothetical protein
MAGLNLQESYSIQRKISEIPSLKSAGIAFNGRGMCQVVKGSPMPKGFQTWIVLSEVKTPSGTGSRPALPPPQVESQIASELLGMGLSCGSAVMAGVASIAGVAAAPLTGGASTAISVLAYAGALASAAQCGIAIGRIFNESVDPNLNQVLDRSEWMKATSDILDGISLAAAAASLGSVAQSAIRLSRTSGRPLHEIVRGMTRAERKRLAEDIARYTGKAQTRKAFIRMSRAGQIPKIFSQQQINDAVIEQLLNAVSSALDVAGSAKDGLIHGFVVHLTADE